MFRLFPFSLFQLLSADKWPDQPAHVFRARRICERGESETVLFQMSLQRISRGNETDGEAREAKPDRLLKRIQLSR